MKSWTDLKLIAKPPAIQALPVDARGYPVQFTAATDENGVPDFRIVDDAKWRLCIENGLCGICGRRLKSLFYFVGGPRSIKSRMFFDVPMHRDCATYALQVCPFLAAPKFAYSRADKSSIEGFGEITIVDQMSTDRPEYFGLGLSSGYSLADQGGTVLLRAYPFVYIQWWKNGQQLEKEPS